MMKSGRDRGSLEGQDSFEFRSFVWRKGVDGGSASPEKWTREEVLLGETCKFHPLIQQRVSFVSCSQNRPTAVKRTEMSQSISQSPTAHWLLKDEAL